MVIEQLAIGSTHADVSAETVATATATAAA
jgi:hypothetical protein